MRSLVRSAAWRGLLAFVLSASGAAQCSAQQTPAIPAPPEARAAPLSQHWVGTWATAPQLVEPNNLPPAPGLGDTTLRQIVHVSIGGKLLRVRLANFYGTTPLTITSVHIAISAGGGKIDVATDRPLTFGGSTSLTIPPGAPAVSDPLAFALPPESDVAITMHVADSTATVTGHPGSRATSYLATSDFVGAEQLNAPATTAHWYYLYGVDVLDSDKAAAAVATIGDSITDGRGSTTDANNRWPDILATRLLANPMTAHIGVLNEGIGGNRMLGDGLGPSVLARLDHDALALPGVKWVILFEGINDLGSHGENAPDLIAAYRQVITRCHARGIKVYGATITPCGNSFYASPKLEAARQQINAWIRTGGEYDAVIDFDAAVRDHKSPAQLRPNADSGDHLHPSPEGYRLLAEAIGLAYFQ